MRSVLEQTFDDLEVIVCDNSDAGNSETEACVAAFDDARVRFVRTSGDLSMPDNWERAIADARGEYVGVLTDRSVYRRDALETVRHEIERTGARCVSWFNDLYGRDPDGTSFKRRASTSRRHDLSRDEILDFFLNGDPKYSNKIIPKLMTGAFHRSILESARASAVGRCCPPICPDYTSGFLALAFSDRILLLDEALYVSCGYGTGSAFRSRSELGDRFRSELGMSWSQMVDRMPSDACFSHALVLNDFVRVRDALPERFPGVEINRVQYYVGCMTDYVKTARRGVRRSEDMEALLRALESEPAEIRNAVRSTKMFAKVEASVTGSVPNAAKVKLAAAVRDKVEERNDVPGFDDVFEALTWDEANPRTPAVASFVDLRPAVDDEKLKRVRARVREHARQPASWRRLVRKKARRTIGRIGATRGGASAIRLRERLRARSS